MNRFIVFFTVLFSFASAQALSPACLKTANMILAHQMQGDFNQPFSKTKATQKIDRSQYTQYLYRETSKALKGRKHGTVDYTSAASIADKKVQTSFAASRDADFDTIAAARSKVIKEGGGMLWYIMHDTSANGPFELVSFVRNDNEVTRFLISNNEIVAAEVDRPNSHYVFKMKPGCELSKTVTVSTADGIVEAYGSSLSCGKPDPNSTRRSNYENMMLYCKLKAGSSAGNAPKAKAPASNSKLK